MFQSVLLRRIHRFLAVWLSFAFVLVLVTGTILAWHATGCNISAQGNAPFMDGTSISDLMKALNAEFDFIDAIEFDECGHVFVRGEHVNFSFGNWEWDVQFKRVVGERAKANRFVQWATVLHRSFFLGTLGRVWAAVSSVLFLVLAFSGLLLWMKTFGFQLKRSRILHVDLGVVLFVPLCILCLTGVSMSAAYFNLWEYKSDELDSPAAQEMTMKEFEEFEIFQALVLNEMKSIDFPFAFDSEEWFQVRFRNGEEISVDALTGREMAKTSPGWQSSLLKWLTEVHTGEKSLGWSLLWLFSGAASCLSIWTGLQLWYRKKYRPRATTLEEISNVDIALVVASQGGSTWGFAEELQRSLERTGRLVRVLEFENFSPNSIRGHVIFMVATYGRGAAPEHLWNWRNQIDDWDEFSADSKLIVMGFGDRKYERFAQFGKDLSEALEAKKPSGQSVQSYTVNTQSWSECQTCVDRACLHLSLAPCSVNPPATMNDKSSEISLEVQQVSGTDSLIWIEFAQKGKSMSNTQSGDLVAFGPPGCNTERYYSLSVQPDGTYGICVRLIPNGKCSTWLSQLESGSMATGRIQINSHFHVRKTDENLFFVANGSGIGPLLGMIASLPDTQGATVLWGIREEREAAFAHKLFDDALKRGALKKVYTAFSRQPMHGIKYVQDFFDLADDHLEFWKKPKARFIVCGSNDMLEGLVSKLMTLDGDAFQTLRQQNKWQSDCY